MAAIKCLFSESAVPNRDQPSFPTRRSSDLARGEIPRFERVIIETSGVADPAPLVDRKSTRLNSSHRCMSYAVVCLKKKNCGRKGHPPHRSRGGADARAAAGERRQADRHPAL